VSASLRLAFVGNDAWSVPSLRAVAATAHELSVVITRVPRPAGRGSRLRPTAVADAAREDALPLVEIETVRSGAGFDAIRSSDPDLLVVVAYGEILPPPVLDVPARGCVNVHFSLLPALRGAAPVRHALLNGDEVTGVTTMLMDEGLDTGPVLLQQRESIRPDDDSASLGERLAELGARLLVETIDGLAAASIDPRPQDDTRATWAPVLTAADRLIDWSVPARDVVDRIRALAPRPATTTRFRARPLKLFRARAAATNRPDPADPGTVVETTSEGPLVAAGEGEVLLLDLAPAGRKRMSGGDFARGYHPEPGELLV
jgi:methionyl-tRNA formyltransferase